MLPEAEAAIFRKVSRGSYYYAKWKYKLDPIYKFLAQADIADIQRGPLLILGCGLGLELNLLARTDRKITAVDWSEKRTAAARKLFARRYPDLQIQTANIHHFRFPHKYQTILLIDVLHYIKPVEQDVLLQKTCEHLIAGGSLMIRDSDRDHFIRFVFTYLFEAANLGIGFTQGLGIFFPSFSRMAALLRAQELTVDVTPMWGKTFFANKMIRAYKCEKGSSISRSHEPGFPVGS